MVTIMRSQRSLYRRGVFLWIMHHIAYYTRHELHRMTQICFLFLSFCLNTTATVPAQHADPVIMTASPNQAAADAQCTTYGTP